MASKTKRHQILRRIYQNTFNLSPFGRPSKQICSEIIKKLEAPVKGEPGENLIGQLINWCRHNRSYLLVKVKPLEKPRSDKTNQLVPKQSEYIQNREAFYKSWEWRKLRMEALKLHGPRCQCCGAGRGDVDIGGNPVRIVVDHIEPLSRRWDLRLVLKNLQILCDECNMGKGAWDKTDWRNI